MGPSYKARAAAAALAAAAASFAPLASAQGFYYEDLKPDCPAQYNQRYLGCYAATANPFPWTPVNQDLTATGDLSKSYIHWITSTTWNITITPNFCTEVCRAHGLKYASLWNGECSCGNSLDYTDAAGTPVTLTDKVQPDGDCVGPEGCPGDRLEACGTATRARIFVDPSFEDAVAENDLIALVAGYEPLGCFKDPNFPTSQDTVTTPDESFDGPAECFAYCADLGKPLVFMSSDAGDAGQVRCFCGQDFGVKAQEQTPPDDGSCSLDCSDISVTTCTGQNCCGTANGPFPVYANPDLMGCYVPRIPGKSDPAVVTPAWDAYSCFETPDSILNRAVASAPGYNGATVSRAATFLATATATASMNEWILYACYGQDYVDQALAAGYLTAPDATWTAANPLTPDNCAAFCETQTTAYDYVGLAGAGIDQKCYCATGLGGAGTGSNGPTMVQDCNQPCRGDDEQMCGNVNGPIVYARPAVAAAGEYAQSSSSYATTPVYTCTPTSASTSSSASSTSSSASASTSSSATMTVSLSSASQSATSTSSSGSASDTSSSASSVGPSGTSSTTTSAGPSDTASTSSAGPSDTATTSSTGPSDTASTSSTEPSDTASSSSAGPSGTSSTNSATSSDPGSSTSSAGPSDTASTSSTGPSDTASSSSTGPSDTATTSSTGPSDTASVTLSSDTVTLTSPSETASATSSSESASTTGPSDSSSAPSDTASVTDSSMTASSSGPSDTASSTGPSESVSSTGSSDTVSVTGSSSTTASTTGPSDTVSVSVSVSGSFSVSMNSSAILSTRSSVTASTTTGPSSSGSSTGPSSSGRATSPSSSGGSTGPSGPSGTSSSTTPSSTDVPVPGATTLPGDIFFGILRIGAGGGQGLNLSISANASSASSTFTIAPMRKSKRQDAISGFLGDAAGPVNPPSCADATLFTLQNGALGVGGLVISVDPGVPYIEFRVGDGAISETFTVVNGMLYWYNVAFFGRVAGFCQVPSGQIYATFSGPDDVPPGCEPIQLVMYNELQCVDGGIIPVLPTISASATGTATGPATLPTGPTGIPSEDGIYPLGTSPTGQLCVTVTESWVPGEPTFIHDEL